MSARGGASGPEREGGEIPSEEQMRQGIIENFQKPVFLGYVKTYKRQA